MAFSDIFKKTIGSWSWGKVGVADSFSANNTEEVADVFMCIKILSENISKMTPQVRGKDNRVMDHDINPMLGRRPNYVQNSQVFWQTLEYLRDVYGNSYAYIDRDSNGYAKKLHILNNSSVLDAKISEAGKLLYGINFAMTPTIYRTDSKNIPAEDILHFRHQSKDGIFGLSPLAPLQSYASILSKASKMLDSFYGNNAMSTLALKTELKSAATGKKLSEATDDFMEKHSADQSGKVIALPPNTDLIQINQKYADAQVIETQRYSKEQIGNMFGIPKFMLNVTDTDQSIEQQTKQFLALALSPILEMYSRELESKLLRDTEYSKGIYIGYDTEKMIETDTKTKAEVTTSLVSKGLMTPNEGATAMGNNPIPSEWGNLHYTQSQNIPYEYYDKYGKETTTNTETNKKDNGRNEEDKLGGDKGTPK